MSAAAAPALAVQPPKRAASGDGPGLALCVGIASIALLATIVIPVAALGIRAFQDAQGNAVWLANFARYFSTPALSAALWNSLWISGLSAFITVALAYPFAYALTMSRMPARGLLQGVALAPLLAPSLLPAISLVYLFGNQGVLKAWLGGASIYGPIGIVIGSVFWTLPHALLILTTALSSMDGRLREAALTLGASRLRIFRTVTLPASRYGLVMAFMAVFVLVLTDFGVPKVIGGGTQMLATDIYKQVVGLQNFQMGAVVGVILLLPAVLAYLIERQMRSRQSASMTVRATPYRPAAEARRDGALLIYCLALAAMIVVMLGMAGFASLAKFWPYDLSLTLKNYRFDLTDGGGWESYWNSLRLALGTAVLGAILCFATAWMVDKPRRLGPAREGLNFMATLPLAVPGLALGLGYILFFNHPSNPLGVLYGSMSLLVICTVVHFLSVAHMTLLAALRQLDREYELVAESLGVNPWTHILRVHLPICLPALLQVAGYFFVNAMTTVSAVVFLYTPQTQLASVAVLNMDDAGDVAPAAAMATLIFLTAACARALLALLSHLVLRKTQHWRGEATH
ncbi:phosphonate ABC transporter permease [beta proteobacterium AAP99]|nr:phosphonate ABC transporter permease [beta proteobacterium AAP99]